MANPTGNNTHPSYSYAIDLEELLGNGVFFSLLDSSQPLGFTTSNTGLPESSPLRFKAVSGDEPDYAAILIENANKVDKVMADTFKQAVETQRAVLKNCKDVGCTCHTDEGSKKWFNDMITNIGVVRGTTHPVSFDHRGISILLSGVKDLVPGVKSSYVTSLSKLSTTLAPATKIEGKDDSSDKKDSTEAT